jgi:hypothetical protein
MEGATRITAILLLVVVIIFALGFYEGYQFARSF